MLRLLRREGLPEAYKHRPIGRMIRAGLRNELKAARHRLRPPVRFVIFPQGRTGSTLLTSTLDTHPQITCHDEILGQLRAVAQCFVENVAQDKSKNLPADAPPELGFLYLVMPASSESAVDEVEKYCQHPKPSKFCKKNLQMLFNLISYRFLSRREALHENHHCRVSA